ncbi:MAG: alpha/beta hydrolase [Balneolaceae bacterium]
MQKLYVFLILFITAGCTTIEINERDAFDNHKTVTPESFDISALTLYDRTIETEDNVSINAWFLLRDDAEATVLYFGGNGFLMVKSRPLIESYATIPVNLVLFDYRGYGLSGGDPSVEGIQTDAQRMFEAVQELAGERSTPLFIHGHSMGSFLSGYIADRENVAGYIFESPISEVNSWTRNLVPWLLRPFIRFDIDSSIASQNNLDRVSDIEHPLLIIGGSDDDITPFSMAEELLAASASDQKDLVKIEDGTHNDLPEFEQYRISLEDFLFQN